MPDYLENLKMELKNRDFEVRTHHSKWRTIRVSTTSLQSVAEFLREKLGFDHAISVSVIDDNENEQFIIGYHLSSVLNPELHGEILTLETIVPHGTPSLSSLVEIWPSVEWHEREGWEMFGVFFEKHPLLERLLLPENWQGGYPLRKDFKLGEE